MYKKTVNTALIALANTLIGLSANPFRVDLPRPPGVMKVGVDDFLVSAGRNGLKSFMALKQIPLFLPEGISGLNLMNKHFEQKRWIVKDLLSPGLTVFAGKPKMGKSWLVLALAAGISSGKTVLGRYEVEEPFETVYLALEDSEARIKERLEITGVTKADVEKAYFFCEWPSVANNGLLALERWLEQHPSCRAVFIDTLARVRCATNNDYNYYDDYEAISSLKAIADKFKIAVIVVHHLKKQATDDPFDAISGTTGISGSADTNWVLMRPRGTGDAVLHITGRDISEKSLALEFKDGNWKVVGDANYVDATKTQQEILLLLIESGEPMTPTQIARETQRSVGGLSKTLRRMVRDGQIQKAGKGQYIPLPKKEAALKLQKQESKK